MTNINCFQECLRCGNGDDPSEHYFKFKKGRKFITLTKHAQRESANRPNLITHSSAMTRHAQPEELSFQKRATQTTSNEIRDIRSQEKKRPEQSPVRVTLTRISQNQPQITASSVNQRCTLSLEPRLRRYSLDRTQKPYLPQQIAFAFRPRKQNHNPIENASNFRRIVTKEEESITKPLYEYEMGPIKQESEQKEKCSSLFQGARSIVSRMVTSRKQEIVQNTLKTEVVEDPNKSDIHKFYDSARLCETQNAIVLTHSSIASEQEDRRQYPLNQISMDFIPMSPHTKSINYANFKIGRLLGVGKWAHVYLSLQKQTHSLYAIKQIFKQSFKMACSMATFNDGVNKLISLNHSNLVNVYTKFQTKDRLCMITEFCNRCLFDELRQRGFLPIAKIRKYAADLIKALVYMHQNEQAHGNINVFQVFQSFGECKLKSSLSQMAYADKQGPMSFKRDIEGLAMVIFEMGHGLIPLALNTETLYEKEKLYQQAHSRQQMREVISKRMELSESDLNYRSLNNLIKLLLNWDSECRLTNSICFSHPFFEAARSE